MSNNKPPRITKITLSFEGNDHPDFEVLVDGAEYEHRRGIKRKYTLGELTPDMGPNGQEIICVRGWIGCDSYHDFKPETKEYGTVMDALTRRGIE